LRLLRLDGRRSIEEIVDAYGIQCRPVRDLMIAYLGERAPDLDHTSLRSLGRNLCRLFWRDLERHHPGIDSLRLEPGVARDWKERLAYIRDANGQPLRPRVNYRSELVLVRAFYEDIARRAAEDPARWAPWVAPCPIKASAWAAVETLRLTGCRVEGLLEISHHSLIQYRLPTTGEIVLLLQIIPSKTDEERLLVVSPELADVLSTVIRRIREPDGTVPLVPVYDRYECVWRPPSPVLFQRRFPSEIRAISDSSLRTMLNSALVHTGLKDPADGQPLHYSPHDFRRIFITDAVMSGLPPHIAQVIAGHRDINVTMGYKAVYPDEAIQAHLAFLARRRALRPGEEYRVPTDQEWEEFLGHFELRKVATGTCGRAFGTPCVHEHSCLRCSMHWPDPAQHARIAEIRDNLIARITEAEHEGWLGEVEGLKVSLAGAEDKLAQLDRRSHTTVALGIPGRPSPPLPGVSRTTADTNIKLREDDLCTSTDPDGARP
jgi:integrase